MNLKEKFDFSGLTQADIAKVIGKGVGVVSGILNGNYKSANKELYENAIENYLNNYIADNGLMKDDGILPKNEDESDRDNDILQDNGEWLSLAQSKIKERLLKMGESGLSFFELILGESGMGKTYLLKQVCKNDAAALYVKARRSLSSSAFMSLILRAMGEKAKGNTDDKLETVFEALKNGDIKLIVIDEADLFIRDNDFTFERKFELLREIFEFGKDKNLGISVVAVGLPVLKKRIDRLGGYLQSRLTYSPEMTLNRDELLKIADLNHLDKDVAEYLSSGENARLFEKAAANVALGYEQKVAANLVYATRR